MVLIEQEYEKMLKNEKKKQKKQKTIRIASKQDYGNGEITGNQSIDNELQTYCLCDQKKKKH